MSPRFLLIPAFSAALVLSAQQPYPPNQYPPNQYPPGQYPPNQYPNQYPSRLPGNLPFPDIKFPKRKSKEQPAQQSSVMPALHGIEGTLRHLGEKELIADTKGKGTLQFRVLPKTKFLDMAGQPIRDSLLKPGDRLRLEVNADDEETVLRVTLARKGSESERAAAEKPVDAAKIGTPEGLPPSPWAAAAPPPEPPAREAPKPVDESAPATVSRAPLPGVDSDVEEARIAAETLDGKLPNYVVQQVTTRYVSNTLPAQWRANDVVSAEVAYVNGTEEYRNITVNGRPNAHPETTGAWSTGEFGTTLQDILSLQTHATFKRLGEQTINSRLIVVYEFSVDQANSHWTIVANNQKYNPAYTGTLYIDRQTHRTMRIEQVAQNIPSTFPYNRTECIVDYDYVTLEGVKHLLPQRGESQICQRGTQYCSRNEMEFRNYRQFKSDSQITFQKLTGQTSPTN